MNESSATSQSLDPRAADALYKSFTSFEEWEAKSTVDTVRWNRYSSILREQKDESPKVFKKAIEIVRRAAAVDTGAIEGLYQVNQGFTFTIAMETAMWETALIEKGEPARSLIETQIKAYDLLLDLATTAWPVVEATIRKIHEELCRSQKTYAVQTAVGPQQHVLPLGKYKTSPNHVLGRNGQIHSYAPVDLTPAEMQRFTEELKKENFLKAHPVLQASYAHYGFVLIHPFADGNGRVARALASIFTYRSESVPVLILAESREAYISALEAADAGNSQAFVDFILERVLDSMQMASVSLSAAAYPDEEESLDAIKNLYVTKGGYSHAEVDEAGYKLFDLFLAEFQRQLQEKLASVANLINSSVSESKTTYNVSNRAYRQPVQMGRMLSYQLSTAAPARAQVTGEFRLEVPRDCGKEDDLILQSTRDEQRFTGRMNELLPVVSGGLQLRLRVFAQQLVRQKLNELKESAKIALHGTS